MRYPLRCPARATVTAQVEQRERRAPQGGGAGERHALHDLRVPAGEPLRAPQAQVDASLLLRTSCARFRLTR